MDKIYRDSTMPITREILNKILSLQEIEVSEEEYNIILHCQYHDIDLGDSNNREQIVLATGGKKERVTGVYIWTLKGTDSQYVGGSKNIYKRLSSYFETKLKLINVIMRNKLNKYGHRAFTLRIIILPRDQSTLRLATAIEQYYILKLRPDMNIFKVARASIGRLFTDDDKLNISKERGSKIYVYQGKTTKLIYEFLGRNSMSWEMGVHKATIKKYIDSGLLYRDKYTLTSTRLEGTIENLVNLDQLLVKKSSQAKGKITILAISDDQSIIEFTSVRAAAKHFNVSSYVLTDRLERGMSINGYNFRRKDN